MKDRDARIGLSKLFMIVTLMIVVVGIYTSNITGFEKTMLLIFSIVYVSLMFFGIAFLRKNANAMIVFLILCVFNWIAYFLKLVLTVNYPETSWLSYEFFTMGIVRKELPSSFITLFPGLIALMLGLLVKHKYVSKQKYDAYFFVVKHKSFVIIISLLLVLRYFNQTVLGIGVPGVIPQQFSVPFLTGILEMSSSAVLMALVNLYFYSVLRLRERNGLMMAGILMLFNIILGLRVGYKSELVLQTLFLAYYLFDVREYLSKSQRKTLLLVSIVAVFAVVVIYPYVNYYRNYILSGREIGDAIDSAKQAIGRHDESFFISFINRLNGIDAFFAATKLGQGLTFHIESLFNQDVMDLIKFKLYGNAKDQAVTAFGTTQFSVLYLVGGYSLLTIGSFIMGWSIRWLTSFIPLKILKTPVAFNSYLPFFCILCIKFLSSGGEVLLYLKQLCIVIFSLSLAEKFCFVTKRNELPKK